MIRGALVALLSLEDDMEVVAELDRGDQIVSTALRTRPDVAVLDIDLPGTDEPARHPGARALGARSRLHRQGRPAQTLAAGVRRVAAGERVIDPDLVAAALETGSSPLTARETDVLRVADQGMRTDEIARTLSLAPATRAQLHVERGQQGRWPQPYRGHPNRPRRGMAVITRERFVTATPSLVGVASRLRHAAACPPPAGITPPSPGRSEQPTRRAR